MAEQYANGAETTLSAGIDNVQTTLTLISATGYPAAPFRIRVDDELMYVGARAGTACSSITRGAEGSSAVAHSSGAPITCVLTVSGLRNLQLDITAAAASDVVVAAQRSGDTNDRLEILESGIYKAGPGNAALDVAIQRSAAGLWKAGGISTGDIIGRYNVEEYLYKGGSQTSQALDSLTRILAIADTPDPTTWVPVSATPLIASATDATSYATAAFALVNLNYYVVIVVNTKATTPDAVSTITKTDLVLSLQSSKVNAAGTARISMYYGQTTGVTNSALTVSFGANTQTGCFISVIKVGTGVLPALSIGGTTAEGSATSVYSPTSRTATTEQFLMVMGAFNDAASAPTADTTSATTSIHSGTIATPAAGFASGYVYEESGVVKGYTGTGGTDNMLFGYINLARYDVAPGPITIHGLQGGDAGRMVIINNRTVPGTALLTALLTPDSDDLIILKHQSASATSTQRFVLPNARPLAIGKGRSALFVYDSDISRWRYVSGGGRNPLRTVFTANGTYTPTDGAQDADIEVVGGGGQGGGSAATAAGQGSTGGGGGGGGYAKKSLTEELFSPSGTGVAFTITVGAGGSTGAAAANGQSGGTSSVAGSGITTIQATGGGGGTAPGVSASTGPFGTGGAGGVGTGGDVNSVGADGGQGAVSGGVPITAGPGGSSVLGGGGRAPASSNAAGNTGDQYGGGGAGSNTSAAAGAARAGAAGAAGVVIVTEHFSL